MTECQDCVDLQKLLGDMAVCPYHLGFGDGWDAASAATQRVVENV